MLSNKRVKDANGWEEIAFTSPRPQPPVVAYTTKSYFSSFALYSFDSDESKKKYKKFHEFEMKKKEEKSFH